MSTKPPAISRLDIVTLGSNSDAGFESTPAAIRARCIRQGNFVMLSDAKNPSIATITPLLNVIRQSPRVPATRAFPGGN
jgi:hypothetical protein